MERFTPEQIREYNDAFVMFDNDGSGDILVSELRDMLKTIGFNPKDNVLEIMTIVIDEVIFSKNRFFARFFAIRSDPVQIKRFIEHNSRTTQDKCIKLYIFEISVKFCVD